MEISTIVLKGEDEARAVRIATALRATLLEFSKAPVAILVKIRAGKQESQSDALYYFGKMEINPSRQFLRHIRELEN